MTPQQYGPLIGIALLAVRSFASSRLAGGPTSVRTVAFAFLTAMLAGQAAAQDSWDLEVTSAGDVTVASVTYEGGAGLAVQCRKGTLDVAILGLPPALPADLTRGDRPVSVGFDLNHLEEEWWTTSPGSTVAVSQWSSRSARSLKRGGVFFVRTTPSAGGPPRRLEMPLPTDTTAIDRTLEACGRRTVDPRDDLPEIGELLTEREWLRSRPFHMPDASSGTPSRVGVSCIVAEAGRIRDCQVEYESEPGLGARMLRDERNVRLGLRENAAAAVGRVINMTVEGARIRR